MNATTGSWMLQQGSIQGGTVSGYADGAPELIISGTGNDFFDGVTLNADLNMTTTNAWLSVLGLTLNGTATLSGAGARLAFFGSSQGVDGTGTVILGHTNAALHVHEPGRTFTIGPDITITGNNGTIGASRQFGGPGDTTVINQGTIRATAGGGSLEILNVQTTNNTGSLIADGGTLTVSGLTGATGKILAVQGTINLSGDVAIDGQSSFESSASALIMINGDLLGDTTFSPLVVPDGTTHFGGSGSAGSPQLLEAMGNDLGDAPAGFSENFEFGTLSIGNSNYVQLVDHSNNSLGGEPEAVYTNSLIVNSGSTLDLNGLNLYTRVAQIDGTVVGGSIIQTADSGPLPFATPTPGTISVPGELDEWEFFGRAGRTVAILVNPGSANSPSAPGPHLNFAEIELVNDADNVIASGTSQTSGALATIDNFVLPADGNYRVRVRAAAGHSANTGNYLITAYDVILDKSALNINARTTGRIETPFSVDTWTFSGQVNEQFQFELLNTSNAGLVFTLTGPSGTEVFTGLTGSSGLVNLTETGKHTLSAFGTNGRTGDYAFILNKTTVTDLDLDTPFQGTWSGSGDARLFRIEVPQAGNLVVSLDDDSEQNRNEVYSAFQVPPTRGNVPSISDLRAQIQIYRPAPDRRIILPSAYAGTWYVLVYGGTIAETSAFTITATVADLVAEAVTPDHHSNSADTVMTISGVGFDNTTEAALVASDGTVYEASSAQIDLSSQITATFSAGTVPAGTYTVRVSKPGGVSELPDAFEMVSGGEAVLETKLIVPATVGRHAVATYYVEYANTGTVAMPAPLLLLQSADPDNSDRPLLTLDQSRVVEGFWTSATPDGFSNSIYILASGETPGVLQPGERIRVPVYYAGLQQPWDFSDASVEMEIRYFTADETELINWIEIETETRPQGMTEDVWGHIFANIVGQTGTTWGDYVKMLDDNAAYLGRLGLRVFDVSELWGFEVQQANGMSLLDSLSTSEDANVAVPGDLELTFDRVFPSTISGRHAMGPLGYGWSTEWNTSLNETVDGTVEITESLGGTRRFQPDSRQAGEYFSQDGRSLVKLSDGSFLLTDPTGRTTAFGDDGRLEYVEDINGSRISTTYTNGLLASLEHSSGQSLTFAYNSAGLIETVTLPDGRHIRYAYDVANEHLLSVTGYGDHETHYMYSSDTGATHHALARIEFPGGTSQFFGYDASGRLAMSSRDNGHYSIQYNYGSAGDVIFVDAAGNTERVFFDHRGLVSKTVDALQNALYFKYDSNLALTTITDSEGISHYFRRDKHGNIVQDIDQQGSRTNLTYDDYGRTTSVTDARGNSIYYKYDSSGRPVSITYDDGSTEYFLANDTGEVILYTNRRGETVEFEYDSAGRLTHRVLPDGSEEWFEFDEHGNTTAVIDHTGTTVFGYDTADRVANVNYPSGRFVSYEYDAGGRRSLMADSSGTTVRYEYSAVGNLIRVADESDSTIVAYSYDSAGLVTRIDKGNATFSTYQYDGADQLIKVTNFEPGGSEISFFEYLYDSLGRRIGMGTADGEWSYTYDSSGQLVQAIFDSATGKVPSQDITYAYDAAGNRIRKDVNGVTTEYSANGMNQYESVGMMQYIHDRDGNLVGRGVDATTANYGYDALNRLTSVVTAEGAWSYEYDAFGNLNAVVHDGNRVEYLLDPLGTGNIIAEYDSDGDVIASYIHGIGVVRMDRSSTDEAYFEFDGVGSTASLTDASGSIVNEYAYGPFGEALLVHESLDNPFEFAGRHGVMRDGTNLDYMRARFYDSQDGRFLSTDPVGISGGSSNLYLYAANSPVVFVDATGEAPRPAPSPAGTLAFCAGAVLAAAIAAAGRGSPVSWVGVGALILTLPECVEGIKEHGFQRVLDEVKKQYEANAADPPGETPDPGEGNQGDSGDSDESRSMDPNEKTGPSGFGYENFIRATEILPYRIDFENDETATAPAQRVDVTDQLSAAFDWDTFELTEVGFGDIFISVPRGSQYFRSTVAFAYNGKTFDVEIEIGLDLQTGLLAAHFQSVDPTTQLPPDVLTGFLPPEDGTGRGMGHFSYTIELDDGLPSGTEVRNIAIIQFDHGEIIATNQVDPHDPSQGTDPDLEALVTIDAGAPASVVLPLAIVTTSTSFTVSWSGTDDAGGSGVAAYNVFVSDNGGPFVLWQIDTTLTEATFDGEDGHTYAFYSMAQDSVGHAEAKLPAADTQTRIQQRRPEDVDDDMDVDVLDALIVIHDLLTFGPRELDEPATQPYLDVNNDGQLGVIDAILVINYLLNPPSPSFLPERVFPAESETPSKLGEVSEKDVESGTDLDWDTLALGTAMDRAAKERRSIDGFFSQLNDPIDRHQENDAWTESLAD